MAGETNRTAPTNEAVFDWLHATLRQAPIRRAWRTLGERERCRAVSTHIRPKPTVSIRYGPKNGFTAVYELSRADTDSPVTAVHRFGPPRSPQANPHPNVRYGEPASEYRIVDPELIRVDLAGIIGWVATARPELMADAPLSTGVAAQ